VRWLRSNLGDGSGRLTDLRGRRIAGRPRLSFLRPWTGSTIRKFSQVRLDPEAAHLPGSDVPSTWHRGRQAWAPRQGHFHADAAPVPRDLSVQRGHHRATV